MSMDISRTLIQQLGLACTTIRECLAWPVPTAVPPVQAILAVLHAMLPSIGSTIMPLDSAHATLGTLTTLWFSHVSPVPTPALLVAHLLFASPAPPIHASLQITNVPVQLVTTNQE